MKFNVQEPPKKIRVVVTPGQLRLADYQNGDGFYGGCGLYRALHRQFPRSEITVRYDNATIDGIDYDMAHRTAGRLHGAHFESCYETRKEYIARNKTMKDLAVILTYDDAQDDDSR